MVTIAIDRDDQLRKGHAALAGDFLQTVPELVFKADACLVACNDNRTLRNRRLQDFLPQMSHRYYITLPEGQENSTLSPFLASNFDDVDAGLRADSELLALRHRRGTGAGGQ